jgi:hypothetical protein
VKVKANYGDDEAVVKQSRRQIQIPGLRKISGFTGATGHIQTPDEVKTQYNSGLP